MKYLLVSLIILVGNVCYAQQQRQPINNNPYPNQRQGSPTVKKETVTNPYPGQVQKNENRPNQETKTIPVQKQEEKKVEIKQETPNSKTGAPATVKGNKSTKTDNYNKENANKKSNIGVPVEKRKSKKELGKSKSNVQQNTNIGIPLKEK